MRPPHEPVQVQAVVVVVVGLCGPTDIAVVVVSEDEVVIGVDVADED